VRAPGYDIVDATVDRPEDMVYIESGGDAKVGAFFKCLQSIDSALAASAPTEINAIVLGQVERLATVSPKNAELESVIKFYANAPHTPVSIPTFTTVSKVVQHKPARDNINIEEKCKLIDNDIVFIKHVLEQNKKPLVFIDADFLVNV
jgi:hypothetical protein